MKETGGILPPGFLTFVKFTAVLGFLSFEVFIIALIYKFFIRILGEEKAKKYKKLFFIVSFILLLISLFIFMIFFGKT